MKDYAGNKVETIDKNPAQPGKDIHTTIDVELQKLGEELMKNKLISAEGQVKASERKVLKEIEQRAIDLSIEKVKVSLSKSLSGSDYERHFDSSINYHSHIHPSSPVTCSQVYNFTSSQVHTKFAQSSQDSRKFNMGSRHVNM